MAKTAPPIVVPSEICRRRDITATEKLLYGFLLDSPGATGRDCASALGMTEDAVWRSREWLRAAELIEDGETHHA